MPSHLRIEVRSPAPGRRGGCRSGCGAAAWAWKQPPLAHRRRAQRLDPKSRSSAHSNPNLTPAPWRASNMATEYKPDPKRPQRDAPRQCPKQPLQPDGQATCPVAWSPPCPGSAWPHAARHCLQDLAPPLDGLLPERLGHEPDNLHFCPGTRARPGAPACCHLTDRAWLRGALQDLEAAGPARCGARVQPGPHAQRTPVRVAWLGTPTMPGWPLVGQGADAGRHAAAASVLPAWPGGHR